MSFATGTHRPIRTQLQLSVRKHLLQRDRWSCVVFGVASMQPGLGLQASMNSMQLRICMGRQLGKNIGRVRVRASAGVGVKPWTQPQTVLGWAREGIESGSKTAVSRARLQECRSEKAEIKTNICKWNFKRQIEKTLIHQNNKKITSASTGGSGIIYEPRLSAKLLEGLESSCLSK